MKKKNGFTLIELLAILVILAIIAVITIPKINKVINESKQNAARNSAYGYKDAIEKWEASQYETDDIYLNGRYTITNGKLDNYTIPITGTAPSSGYLTYEDDDLISGCLVINGYEAIYQNGKFTSTGKGDCNGSNIAGSCANDEYLYEIYNYVVTDQNACETYFNNDFGCEGNEECLQQVSTICSNETPIEVSLTDAINNGFVNYSDVENFVKKETTDSWCRLKSEECFKFSDNGDGTATLKEYLCGAKFNIETGTYDTDGKILDVNIPSQLTGKNGKLSLTSIGDSAFSDNKLTSITIPNSVTTIESSAFSSNQLENITLPNSVTSISYFAFKNNNLTSIEIPNSVTSIGTEAFSNNQLENVILPTSITTIGSGAFSKNELESVTIPESVTTIEGEAFKYNRLSTITIPNGVTSIGNDAFSYNQLESVILPTSVTTIGSGAFYKNSEETSFGNAGDEYYKIYYANKPLTTIYNNTGRSFDWKSIVGSSSSASFETGTINNSAGNVTVTTGYPSNNSGGR